MRPLVRRSGASPTSKSKFGKKACGGEQKFANFCSPPHAFLPNLLFEVGEAPERLTSGLILARFQFDQRDLSPQSHEEASGRCGIRPSQGGKIVSLKCRKCRIAALHL